MKEQRTRMYEDTHVHVRLNVCTYMYMIHPSYPLTIFQSAEFPFNR